MAAQSKTVGDRILLSPREPLVAGGPAEAFEKQVQALLRQGHRNLVVDLSSVKALDSAGVRALVRGHTSAQRVGGILRLAAAPPQVLHVLELSHLKSVFEFYESVDAARLASWPWKAIKTAAAGTVLCSGLIWLGLTWPDALSGLPEPGQTFPPSPGAGPTMAVRLHPFIELGKLVAAALIGLLVSAVHQPTVRERPMARSMGQAQTLLCVSGAMMMIIIGTSLVRAFGIAGAASIIRFRTPVDDPKDVTILFILMALGMAAGLGSFAVAGLATAFLCITLLALDRVAKQQARLMAVEIVANGRQFPSNHVEEVFARNQIVFEPREITQADDVTVKYHTWIDPRMSLEELSAQLVGDGTIVSGVAWEHPKRA